MATNLVAAAVLSVKLLLPAFNQFAERAELDLQLPLEEKRVTKSYVSKNPRNASVMAVFDGHHQFNWESYPGAPFSGRIDYYDNQNSAARLEGPKLRELTKGTSLISTNEAREIAERCLRNLGYDLKRVKAGNPRVIQWRFDLEGTGADPIPLPAYAVRWFPKGNRKPHWSEELVEIEVSGLTKKVTQFTSMHGAANAVRIDLRNLF